MANRTTDVPVQSNFGAWASRQSVEFLLAQLDAGVHRNFLALPLVASLCAGIEGQINTAYVDLFHEKLGKEYRRYVKPYLLLRVEERFRQLPLLLSNFRFALNEDDHRVKLVLGLFDLRNHLLHAKHLVHYADITHDDDGSIIGIRYHEKSHPDPYRFGEGDLVASDQLRAYIELFNEFIHEFSGLASRTGRRNFNRDGWFVRVEP